MSVQEIREVAEDRTGPRGQVGRRLYRRHFIVITNSSKDGPVTVLSAAGLPQPYEPYVTESEFDFGAIVRLLTPQQRPNTRTMWDVWVDYDTEFEPFDNPFTEPPEIEDDSEFYDEPLLGTSAVGYSPGSPSPNSGDPIQDGDEVLVKGVGYVTSAGEVFDPPPTRPQSRPIVTFTRNQASYSIATKVAYESHVNSEPWSGLQRRQAFCRAIRGRSHVWKSTTVAVPNIFYYRVSYTFALKKETWDLQLPDIGSWYLDWSSGTAVKRSFRVEGTGEPRMGLLDHSNADQPGKRLTSDEQVQWLRWRDTHMQADFNALAIDLNLALANRNTRKRRLGNKE
jgi:hypothetical protein